MKIVPIVLAVNESEFEQQFQKVVSLTNQVSIDIADGLAAPNTTLSLEQILKSLRDKGDQLADKKLDFDLMVKDWVPLVETLQKQQNKLKINSVVIHQKYLKKLPVVDFTLGVALDPDDEISIAKLKRFPLIQIMTIDLGFQGSPFKPETLVKITTLRQNQYAGQIVIDGGVNDQTLPLILENKGLPDILGVGSFLTSAENPQENYNKLEYLINAH